MQAIELYRARFRPSAQLAKPYVMLGVNVFAADTDAEATLLFSSLQQAFVNLRSGRPGQAAAAGAPATVRRSASPRKAMLDYALSCSAVGSRRNGRQRASRHSSRRTGADELMVTAQIFDHAARLRSFEILAGLRDRIGQAAA